MKVAFDRRRRTMVGMLNDIETAKLLAPELGEAAAHDGVVPESLVILVEAKA